MLGRFLVLMIVTLAVGLLMLGVPVFVAVTAFDLPAYVGLFLGLAGVLSGILGSYLIGVAADHL